MALLEATNARIKHEVNCQQSSFPSLSSLSSPFLSGSLSNISRPGEGPGGAFEENRGDGRREPGAACRGVEAKGGEPG